MYSSLMHMRARALLLCADQCVARSGAEQVSSVRSSADGAASQGAARRQGRSERQVRRTYRALLGVLWRRLPAQRADSSLRRATQDTTPVHSLVNAPGALLELLAGGARPDMIPYPLVR